MMELPASPAPNGARARHLNPPPIIRGAVGGPSVRLQRLGQRYGIEVTFPPMEAAEARVFVSRLIRASSEGLRIPFPLLGEVQDGAGAPVVDGADQSGLLLKLREVKPGYFFREGSWLSIEDSNGQHYLHNVASAVRVPSDGEVTLTLSEMLRAPFADGATVHVAKPMIEGFLLGEERDWVMQVGNLVQIGFSLEEAA